MPRSEPTPLPSKGHAAIYERAKASDRRFALSQAEIDRIELVDHIAWQGRHIRALEVDLARQREATRRLAIQPLRSTQRRMLRCAACAGAWDLGEPERHAPDPYTGRRCLAAPQEG